MDFARCTIVFSDSLFGCILNSCALTPPVAYLAVDVDVNPVVVLNFVVALAHYMVLLVTHPPVQGTCFA